MAAFSTHASWRVAALLLVVLPPVVARGLSHPCRAEPLPEGAVARLGEFRKFDGRKLAYSPDGKYVAAVYLSRLIRLYDAKTGAPAHLFDGHKSYVRTYVFSPDGRYLASAGSDKHVCLWDVADGGRLKKITLGKHTPFPWVPAVAFSHDSEEIFVGGSFEPPAICVFDVAGGDLLRTIDPPTKRISQLLASPDGKTLLGMAQINRSDKKTAWLKDLASGKTRFEMQDRMTRWSFSPDGRTLACVRYDSVLVRNGTRFDYQVRFIDPADGAVRETIEGTRAFAFSPNSRLLAHTAADDSGGRHVLVRDLKSGKEVLRVHPHQKGFSSLQLLFSPDGTTLLVNEHWRVREYDVETGAMRPVPLMHEGKISALDWSRDGRQLVTASGEFVAFWDVASQKIARQLRADGRLAGAHQMELSPSHKLLATSRNNPIDPEVDHPAGTATTRLWETETGKLRWEFTTRGAQSIAFSPDEKLLAVGAETEHTHILDVQTGQEIRKLTTTPLGQSAAFLPDGRRLAVGSDKHVHIWDVTTREIVTRLDGGRGSFVKLLCPVPNNLGLISKTGGQLVFWDLNTSQYWLVFAGSYRGTDRMTLSNDGRLLAVTGAHRDPTVVGAATTREHQIPCIRLFDVATGAVLHQFVRPGHDFGELSFSPDGGMLAATAANTVLLFDVGHWTGADQPEPRAMSDEQFAAAWEKVGSVNAQDAYAAMSQLRAAGGASVEFISEHVRPLRDRKPAPQVLAELVKRLDHREFDNREQAAEELKRIGPSIVPELERLSRESPSTEVRFRAREIVQEIRSRNGFVIESAEKLRRYRAIQVLEQLGTPAADRLLERLADGAPGRQTIEAKLAVERRSRDSY